MMSLLTKSTRLAVLAAGCLALVASCSSGSDDTANYVGIDAAPVEANAGNTGNTANAGCDGDLAASLAGVPVESRPTDDFEVVTAVFDDFLVLRAQAITEGRPLADLASLATPGAIQQVGALRETNDSRIEADSYAAQSRLAEWSNVGSITERDDRLFFTDCTESQYLTPGGGTVINFVTNEVEVVENEGTYKVASVVVSHDGVVSTDPENLGCVPDSFAERAATTTRAAVQEASRLIADPVAARSQPLAEIFAGEARTELDRTLEALVQQRLSRTADEVVQYNVIGMDVNRADFTVVVAVCRIYPNGRSYIDANGELTVSDLASGSSLEEWVYIQLEATASSDQAADTVIAVQSRGQNCQRG